MLLSKIAPDESFRSADELIEYAAGAAQAAGVSVGQIIDAMQQTRTVTGRGVDKAAVRCGALLCRENRKAWLALRGGHR